MKYAQSDSKGNITGYFDDSINSIIQIGASIGITELEWIDCINNPGKWLIVAGALQLAPAPTTAQILAAAQTTQCAAIDAAYLAAITANISYMGATFQADATTRQTLSYALAGGSAFAPPAWYDITNTPIAMTYVQLQAFAGAMIARGNLAYVNKQTKKAAIRSATTISAVNAIVF